MVLWVPQKPIDQLFAPCADADEIYLRGSNAASAL